MSGAALMNQERNPESTLYVGNIDEQCSEALLWEIFVQAGPLVTVHLPKDRVTMQHQGYGFLEFASEEDADYAHSVMAGLRLFGRALRINKASADRREAEVSAMLFVGSLGTGVTEHMLHDAFSHFGTLAQLPRVVRDSDTGESKGYAFLGYDSFEAADAAIAAMNGQFLMDRPISVSYAFRKDGKGERHGSAAERLLAARARKHAPNSANVSAAAAAAHAPATAPFKLP